MAERKKLNLEPGRKYKGVGYVNEYGEMNFTPYQVGTKKNGLKVVKEGDNFSLYESINTIQVRVCIERTNSMTKLEKVTLLMKAFSNACVELKKYL